VDYAPGTVEIVEQHDGSSIALRKLKQDYDVHDRRAAITNLLTSQAAGEIVTGLLYAEEDAQDLHDAMNTVETPLNALGEAELCPGTSALDRLNAGLR
jgi:2-oxoglutarate ferredoxin oxidoreductase subunit beta